MNSPDLKPLLFDQSPLVHVLVDGEMRIVHWNDAASGMYGWSTAEVIGKKDSEVFQPHLSAVNVALQECLKSGSWTGPLIHKNKKGETLPVYAQWTRVPKDASGSRMVLIVTQDVSQRLEVEAQAASERRLESIRTLSWGLAHDLNNAFSPMLMAGQLLRQMDLPAEAAGMVEMMATNAERGARVVRQLLIFAKGVEGQREIIAPCDLAREAGAWATEQFPGGVLVELNLPERVPDIRGDRTHLLQALIHLCQNAHDAMPKGGVVKIGVQEAVLTAPKAGDAKESSHVVFVIQDQGRGILPQIRERIWDPFFTTKAPGSGTGLGLSVVSSIVRSHEGFVTFDSELGKGSTFKVFLPALPKTKPMDESSNIHEGGGETILLVDDDASFRELVGQILTHHGYEVVLAMDGVQGMTMLTQLDRKVQLVVTDLSMPGMDGIDFIQCLRRIDVKVPIIVASGAGARTKKEDLLRLNVRWTLAKPFHVATLLKTIHQALHQPAKAG